jgi:hypothetical protein
MKNRRLKMKFNEVYESLLKEDETKVKKVKISGSKIIINTTVSNEYLSDDITWTYDAKTDKVSADSAMNQTTGWLILALLQQAGHLKNSDDYEMNHLA